ncbi:DUF5131 family protein [Mesoterricola sediminis]|uniref:Protein gp37 n=1 Tax=Mesoterricola sediminis TaxID=2927980 RepID=A0AA48HDF9_9BACT|nr:DUF5131 family protein [Mesoterricola sediminis]BDU76233.1 hypothetical protein METESE_11910 [Mesoterricola sediminis]
MAKPLHIAVSPLTNRIFPGHWGQDAPRRMRVDAASREAMRYERQAVAMGTRFRVFTNSMADFFEDRRDLDADRAKALEVMFRTPHLDWLILTKRPEAILGLLKRAERETDSTGCSDWIRRWLGWGQNRPIPPTNVWLGTTVEDQERANQRIPYLLRVPSAVRFLSCEPLLGPVDLTRLGSGLDALKPRLITSNGAFLQHPDPRVPSSGGTWAYGLDWVICGGESGPHARPMHPGWARGLRDQCAAARIPFLFKQWGEWVPEDQEPWSGKRCERCCPWPEDRTSAAKVGKHLAGRVLDGIEHNGYPTAQATA